MKHSKINYRFRAKPWQYAGPAGWYFVSLPKRLSKEIRQALRSQEEGWGRLKAIACIGGSEWNTAIWYDTKQTTYLLPLKADIRKKERIETGQPVEVLLWV